MDVRSAVVLAAGEGDRLRPLTKHRPKPMLPAARRPILEHVFDQLIEAGIEEIVVVVGYRRQRVQSHFGATYRNVPLTYVSQQNQLGTGHALLTAKPSVAGACIVINGDQIVDSRIVRDVVDTHDSDAAASLALLHRPVAGYGGVLTENGLVTEIVEDPRDYGERSYTLNAGVYVLESAAFDAIRDAKPHAGEHSIVDGVIELIDRDAIVNGVVTEGLWADATYPWDLLEMSFDLFEAGVVESTQSDNELETTAVHESAVIREPVTVGPDCVIEPGAVVGPHVCLGENVTISSNAVVERSVIDTDTRIKSNATVIDCVTGTGVSIGPGSTVPGGPADVRVNSQIFEDETLGALIADRVHDRGDVTYVPGAIVGPDVELHPGTTVRGTIAENTEVRS